MYVCVGGGSKKRIGPSNDSYKMTTDVDLRAMHYSVKVKRMEGSGTFSIGLEELKNIWKRKPAHDNEE